MKIRIIAALLAAFFVFPVFTVHAHAGGDGSGYCEEVAQPERQQTKQVITEPAPQEIVDITPPEDTAASVVTVTDNIPVDNPGEFTPPVGDATPRPFTPPGTGEVLDNASGTDGKEFFTISTPDENVFYLVIDRQRGTENVYFLNAVTEADLLSLAQLPEVTAPPVVEQPTAPAEPVDSPAEPEPKGGGAGMLVMVLVILTIGGGAGWYFKIFRPKQQQGGDNGEFDNEDYSEDESDPYGEPGADDYDGAGWDSNEDEPDGDGGE